MLPSSCNAKIPETPFSCCGDGARVRVRVAPNAAGNAVQGSCRDADGVLALKVSLTATPERGKANAELIRLLAKQWRLPKSRIVIASGQHERRKTLHVAGDPKELMDRLARWYQSIS